MISNCVLPFSPMLNSSRMPAMVPVVSKCMVERASGEIVVIGAVVGRAVGCPTSIVRVGMPACSLLHALKASNAMIIAITINGISSFFGILPPEICV
jgi:hypothetical protein